MPHEEKKALRKNASRAERTKRAFRLARGTREGYAQLLAELKTRVRTAQIKAAVTANRELIQLYWDIGRLIVERQEREGWGKGVVEHLADDIQRAFLGIKGFSAVNVWRMRSFYLNYRPQAVIELSSEKLSQPVIEFEFGLLRHIEKFLVELGVGFAFVGRQVPVRVGDEDFHIDQLRSRSKLG